MTKQFRGTIFNWSYAGSSKQRWIEGVIVPEDNENRYRQGFRPGVQTPIYTSLIVKVNDDETEVETLNSIYRLENKREN